MTNRLLSVWLIAGLTGCSPAYKNAVPGKQDASTHSANPGTPQRFVPAGADPEIALDTRKGVLCRTVAPSHSDVSKYSKLPMCSPEDSIQTAQPETAFAWDSQATKAPLEASCYLGKDVLPMYSESKPPTMAVASGCIIDNRSSSEQLLVGAVSYDAILRKKDGTMVRIKKVNLASGEKTIPAHGRIEGGLWPNVECSPQQTPASCLDTWLGGATELILVINGSNPVAHLRMNRDIDPLGIR